MGEMTDLSAIEQAANAATPGPWEYKRGFVWRAGKAEFVCEPFGDNPAFIAAANPAVVLALVRELRAARECVEYLRQIHPQHDLVRRYDAVCNETS